MNIKKAVEVAQRAVDATSKAVDDWLVSNRVYFNHDQLLPGSKFYTITPDNKLLIGSNTKSSLPFDMDIGSPCPIQIADTHHILSVFGDVDTLLHLPKQMQDNPSSKGVQLILQWLPNITSYKHCPKTRSILLKGDSNNKQDLPDISDISKNLLRFSIAKFQNARLSDIANHLTKESLLSLNYIKSLEINAEFPDIQECRIYNVTFTGKVLNVFTKLSTVKATVFGNVYLKSSTDVMWAVEKEFFENSPNVIFDVAQILMDKGFTDEEVSL